MSIRRFLIASTVAILSLVSAGAEARKFLDAIGAADRAILADLYDGRITHAEPFSAQQNTGSLWKVKVEHQGRTRWAVFKPRSYGDRDGWGRTPMEVAMYKLDRLLGIDVVPPAAYRRNIWLNGQHFAEGALVLWVDGAHPVRNVPARDWKPRQEAFSSDLRVLQMIGRDADHENGKNIIRGRHWKDGKWRVMKLDNEACMRHGARVELNHSSATWGPVTRFNRRTYQRLKELNFRHLKMDMRGLLSDGEIRQWLQTRDRIVATVDAQVQQRGAQRVFFRPEEIAFDTRLSVGRRANRALLHKFKRTMAKKGVGVQLLPVGDPRLGGARGRTVLARGRITVRLAVSRGKAPRVGTLVEEQVHVNQLRRMAKQVGGLAQLSRRLAARGGRGRAIRASMELYAKGLVKLTAARRPLERRAVRVAQRRYRRQLARAGVRRRPRALWSQALRRVAARRR